MEIFNQIAHEFLIANGYAFEHCEADWEDIGGPESGPQVVGHNAFNYYTATSGNDVVIDRDGAHNVEPLDDYDHDGINF